MKLLSRLTAVLALLALALTAIAGSPRAAETPIRALFTQMTEAWNRGDPAGVAAVFKQDGIMIAGDGTRVATRTNIERYLADLMTKLPKGTTFNATPSSVDFAKADVAILTAEGGFQRPDEATVSAAQQGIQTLVGVREGGVWRVVLFQRTRLSANVSR